MKLVFIGVSHWHTSFYLEPALEMKGTAVVGVSDPNPRVAKDYAERLNCQWSTDYRDLCNRVKPDFVFALGRHCDMPEEARFLIEARIPFAMEKPCGLNSQEVSALANEAKAKGAFAAIPFVMRQGRLLAEVRRRAQGEDIQYLSFRFIAGPVSRYRQAGCDWMLEPAQSGGGCTINLAVHFFDLFRVFMGKRPIRVTTAVMANAAWGLAIEDYSLVVLQSGAKTCLVETGYIYPAPVAVFDMRFSIRTDRHYFVATGPDALEVSDEQGRRETLNLPTTNVPHYRDFVFDILDRVREGRPPLADMADMAEVMNLVDVTLAVIRDIRLPDVIASLVKAKSDRIFLIPVKQQMLLLSVPH